MYYERDSLTSGHKITLDGLHAVKTKHDFRASEKYVKSAFRSLLVSWPFWQIINSFLIGRSVLGYLRYI